MLGKCGPFQTIKPWASSVHIYQPWRLMATLVFPHTRSCCTSGEELPPKLNSWWEVLEERNEKETKKDWAPISIKLIQLKIKMARLNCCSTLCRRRFHFIAIVNSDQKVTGYWHFNQGASNGHRSMCAHPGTRACVHTQASIHSQILPCPDHSAPQNKTFMKERLEDVQRSLERSQGWNCADPYKRTGSHSLAIEMWNMSLHRRRKNPKLQTAWTTQKIHSHGTREPQAKCSLVTFLLWEPENIICDVTRVMATCLAPSFMWQLIKQGCVTSVTEIKRHYQISVCRVGA